MESGCVIELHEYASKFLELHEKYCPNSVVTPTGGKFSDHSAYIKFRMDEMQSHVILNGYPVPVKDFYNKFEPSTGFFFIFPPQPLPLSMAYYLAPFRTPQTGMGVCR